MKRPAARATQSAPPAKPRPAAATHFPPKRSGTKMQDLANALQDSGSVKGRIEVAKTEVAVPVDRQQRRMVDEYGELDRRMQVHAPDAARYDALKRAIKSWFDTVPPDADGIVEGRVYRLHLSARERERRVRSMRDLVAVIGLDKFLELASVPIGALEDLLGKTRAATLVIEARSGSRRIKAVPKRAAGAK